MSVLENFNESMNAITTRLSTSAAISSRQLLLTERFVSFQIFKEIWQPPALPYRLQYSTIGRLGLNHRVRDENGCFPKTHRHQKALST